MNCPDCASDDTAVKQSINAGAVITRYRNCRVCGVKWLTNETIGHIERPKTPAPSVGPCTPVSTPVQGCTPANTTYISPSGSDLSPEGGVGETNALVLAPVHGRTEKRDPEFAQWYAAYPRKEAPRDAQKAWEQTRKDRPPLAAMLATLEWQSEQWTDPKFIPLPATYLRKGRWADERNRAGPLLSEREARSKAGLEQWLRLSGTGEDGDA